MIAQKISILFDAHSLGKKQGGIETYSKNLTRFLSKKPLEILLYTNKKTSLKNSFVPLFDNGLYRILFGFRRALKKKKANILHCNNFLPFPTPKGVKNLVTIHDICFLKEKKFPLKPIFSFFIKHSLKNADRVIATSRFTKRQIIKFAGKDLENKITVIYQASDKYLKKENKNKNGKYFLFSGNVTKRKRPELLNYASEVAGSFDFKLIVSGKDLTKKLEPENIKVLNYVPEKKLADYYKNATAVLLLSDCEGFGLPIVEAWATKTPVICSDVKVFREIAGDAAIFVKNKKELKKAMERIIKGKKFRKELVARGIKQGKKYSWDKTLSNTIEVYKKISSQGRVF